MHPSTLIDAELELIARMRRRDEAAMALFYDRYALNLYYAIHRVVPHPAAAEDVLQDSMVKIWFAFAQYDPTQGRLYTWALTLCKHAAIDHMRAQRSRGSQRTACLHKSREVQGMSTVGFRPEHIGVADWSRQLRSPYQCLLDLLYFEGYTQQEAAETLGWPLGTVKTRPRRALKLLACQLQAT